MDLLRNPSVCKTLTFITLSNRSNIFPSVHNMLGRPILYVSNLLLAMQSSKELRKGPKINPFLMRTAKQKSYFPQFYCFESSFAIKVLLLWNSWYVSFLESQNYRTRFSLPQVEKCAMKKIHLFVSV